MRAESIMFEAAPRRTQAERREGTRAAIVEAALWAFTEVGYARSSTSEIARKAGVSQGALFKHFATKADLVAAAVSQLFADLFQRFDAVFQSRLPRAAVLREAVRPLWKAYCHPRIRAAYMLYAEAPSDAELLAVLQPLVSAHRANITHFAYTRFPRLAQPGPAQLALSLVLLSMQGAALQRCVAFGGAEEETWLCGLEALVAQTEPLPASRAKSTKSRKA